MSTYVHHGSDGGVRADARVSVIPADSVTDKDDLLEALSEALGFPAYVASNWDAFEEAFRDLPEFSDKGKVVVQIDGAEALQDRLGSELGTLAEIWEDNAAEVAAEGVEPHLLLT